MRFIALGGANEVGASSYLYLLEEATLLIDAGLRPGMIGEASIPLLEPLKSYPPDLMLITHAHLDHVGAIPLISSLSALLFHPRALPNNQTPFFQTLEQRGYPVER